MDRLNDKPPACPQLAQDIRDSMRDSALDFLRRIGEPAMPMTLHSRYGFSKIQVAVNGEDAIAWATRQHAREQAQKGETVIPAPFPLRQGSSLVKIDGGKP